MKKYILFLSIAFAASLLMTNIYNSLVDAKSWAGNVPDSIQTARDYFRNVNPGNFYRIFSPANQLLALLALALFWKRSKSLRIFLGVALLFYVLTDVITFAYFYPRNEIIFRSSLAENTEKIKAAATQWSRMNWVRSLIGATGIFFSFRGLDTLIKPGK